MTIDADGLEPDVEVKDVSRYVTMQYSPVAGVPPIDAAPSIAIPCEYVAIIYYLGTKYTISPQSAAGNPIDCKRSNLNASPALTLVVDRTGFVTPV